MATIFIQSGIGKFREIESNRQYMASKGLKSSRFLLPAAAALEIGLGSLLLFGGRSSRAGALALAGYLTAVSAIFHNFWKLEGDQKEMQKIQFMKNLAVIGGLATHAFSSLEEARSERRAGRRPRFFLPHHEMQPGAGQKRPAPEKISAAAA